MEKTDELSKIFVSDGETADRAVLADILSGRVQLTQTGHVVFLPPSRSLGAAKLILVFLAARKALRIRNAELVEEALPSEVEGGTGLPGGTVRPNLHNLKQERLVGVRAGKYFIPNPALHDVKTRVTEEAGSGV
jgi:hypothetical protein